MPKQYSPNDHLEWIEGDKGPFYAFPTILSNDDPAETIQEVTEYTITGTVMSSYLRDSAQWAFPWFPRLDLEQL
jgi:hypothetical protein